MELEKPPSRAVRDWGRARVLVRVCAHFKIRVVHHTDVPGRHVYLNWRAGLCCAHYLHVVYTLTLTPPVSSGRSEKRMQAGTLNMEKNARVSARCASHPVPAPATLAPYTDNTQTKLFRRVAEIQERSLPPSLPPSGTQHATQHNTTKFA